MNRQPREVIIRLLEKKTHVVASCPHCNADGRHIQWFITSTGERKGAMAGCIQSAFYVHELARKRKTWENRLAKYPGWRTAINEIERIDREVTRLFGFTSDELASVGVAA